MKFEVETSSLDSTIKNIETELNSIAQIVKQLYSALEALDGMWIGVAHDTFAVQYQTDQQKLNQVSRCIANVIEGMDSARHSYEQCEASVKTEIKKIIV